MKLTTHDHALLKAAIAKAEKRTSGEILCVVTPEAHEYDGVPVSAGLLALVGASGLMMWLVAGGVAPFGMLDIAFGWASEQTPELVQMHFAVNAVVQTVLAQVAAFVLVAGLCDLVPVKHRLLPRGIQRAMAHEKAVAQFVAQGITRTKARTGVMIFVALAEHHAEVIADEGIFGKVEQRVWDGMVAALIVAIKAGQLRAGLEAAIATCGAVLAGHFPAQEADVNEIGDGVVEV